MHGFSRGHVWFYSGGMHGFIWGVGVCMVYSGGMHGFIWGGVCGFFSFFRYNEIRSMSGRYASYWNAFLFMTYFYRAGGRGHGSLGPPESATIVVNNVVNVWFLSLKIINDINNKISFESIFIT